jgi:hypothetical protein
VIIAASSAVEFKLRRGAPQGRRVFPEHDADQHLRPRGARRVHLGQVRLPGLYASVPGSRISSSMRMLSYSRPAGLIGGDRSFIVIVIALLIVIYREFVR